MSKDKTIGYVPLGQRVLVEVKKEEAKEAPADFVQKGGLFIMSESIPQEKLNSPSGKVLVLGTGLSEDAKKHINVGTEITFKNPHPITYKDVEYYLVHEDNIELIVLP